MARETIERPISLEIDHILQRLGSVFWPTGQAVPIESHLATFVRRGFFRLAAEWFGPNTPDVVEGFLVEIRGQIGRIDQVVVASGWVWLARLTTIRPSHQAQDTQDQKENSPYHGFRTLLTNEVIRRPGTSQNRIPAGQATEFSIIGN